MPEDIITFRHMTSEDIAIYQTWFTTRAISKHMYYPDNNWIKYISGKTSSAWTALRNNQIIGHIQIDETDNQSTSIAMAINPSYQKLGLGPQVLTTFIKTYLNNKPRVKAIISSINIPSQKCFERAGFVKAPDQTGLLEYNYINQIS